MFFLLCRYTDDGVFDDFLKISDFFPKIFEDSSQIVCAHAICLSTKWLNIPPLKLGNVRMIFLNFQNCACYKKKKPLKGYKHGSLYLVREYARISVQAHSFQVRFLRILQYLWKKLIARECDRMRKKFNFFTLDRICARSECEKNSSYGKTCGADQVGDIVSRTLEMRKWKVEVWAIVRSRRPRIL